MFELDTSELDALADEFPVMAREVADELKPIISKGALNIKKQLQDEMGESKYFKQVARAISYDTSVKGDTVSAEIGPVSGPGGVVGDLAGIAYFGGVRGGGGSVPDPVGALEAEAQRTVKVLTDLLERVNRR